MSPTIKYKVTKTNTDKNWPTGFQKKGDVSVSMKVLK